CYAALDRLDAWTGGDAMLRIYRATATLNENKPGAGAKAQKFAEQAILMDGRLLAPRLVLVQSLGSQKRFDDGVQPLETYEAAAGRPLDLNEVPELKELAASDAYKVSRATEKR